MENKDEYNITVHDQFGDYNNTQFNDKFRLRHVRALGPCYMLELTARTWMRYQRGRGSIVYLSFYTEL